MHTHPRSSVTLRLAWLSFLASLPLALGCQQWELRPDIPPIFDPDVVEDDWAPPVKNPSQAEVASVSDGNALKNWWGKRTAQVPRVVLPRNRKAAGEAKTVPPADPATSATAPPIASKPATPKHPSSPSAPNVVAFGGNPSGAPGPLTASPPTNPTPTNPTPTNPAPATPAPATAAPANAAPANAAPSTAVTPPSSGPSTVDTEFQEVDLDGALSTLSPEHREIIRRALTSLRSESESDSGNDHPSLVTETPQAEKPLAAPKGAEATIADTVPAKSASSPSQGISVRLDDSLRDPADSAVVSASTTAAGSKEVSRAVSVQSSPAPQDGPNPPSAERASAASGSWHQMTNQAIEALETQLESSPPADEALRVSQEITLRMLYVTQRRLEEALRPIDALSEHEQEYVRHQMQALYEASNPDANPVRSRHWSIVIPSQREATSHLAAASNLDVRSLNFCTQVDGYGLYQPFARYQFSPDQDVLLYCEIDNVAAQKVKMGYETQLQGVYEIFDSQGRQVIEQTLPMEPEICQNHRRDYFIVYRIYMPQQISPGDYQLRLTIEDMKGKKFGNANVKFEIKKP